MTQQTAPAGRIDSAPTHQAGHRAGHIVPQVRVNTGRTGRASDTTSSALLLTVNQVAALLSVSHWTVRGWIDCGKLASVRLPGGRLLRVERSAVEGLIAVSRMSS